MSALISIVGPAAVAGIPLEKAVGLPPGRKPLDVHKAPVKLVPAVPYAEAQRGFGALTGGGVGRERRPTLTNQVAAELPVRDMAPLRPEIAQRMVAISAGRHRRPVLVLGMDGA